jgi:hypothetical protein
VGYLEGSLHIFSGLATSIVDPDQFDAGPDPYRHYDAVSDPTFFFIAARVTYLCF